MSTPSCLKSQEDRVSSIASVEKIRKQMLRKKKKRKKATHTYTQKEAKQVTSNTVFLQFV
jgi:hypothetical protein